MNYSTSQPPYPNKFKAGDIAVCLAEFIPFSNGDIHILGQKILVTEKTKSYYNVWHHIYDKVKIDAT